MKARDRDAFTVSARKRALGIAADLGAKYNLAVGDERLAGEVTRFLDLVEREAGRLYDRAAVVTNIRKLNNVTPLRKSA